MNRRAFAVLVASCAAGSAPTARGQSLALDRAAVVFTAQVEGASPAPQQVTIRSTPTTAGAWTVTGASVGWLTVTPSGGAGPGAVTLTARSAGLAPGIYHVQLVVTSGPESKSIDVVLLVMAPTGAVPAQPAPPGQPPPPPSTTPPGGTPLDPEILRGSGTNRARYFVEFMFTGYSGLVEGNPDCRVNPQGFDHLIGVLSAVENNEADDNITYTGLMARYTEVDFCETKPRPGRGPDELMWCVADLHGGATMFVELEVYGEEGRGAWLKARPARGKIWKTVGGDCEASTANEIDRAYPGSSDGGGGSPNGQPILDGRGAPLFFTGGVARLRVGTFPVRRPESAWEMRVLARLAP